MNVSWLIIVVLFIIMIGDGAFRWKAEPDSRVDVISMGGLGHMEMNLTYERIERSDVRYHFVIAIESLGAGKAD